METVALIILVFSLLALAESKRSCSSYLITAGYTEPQGDIELLDGQPLELYCTIDTEHPYYKDEGYNASNLIFVNYQQTIEPEYVTVINSTTIRMFIPHPAKSESMYYCMVQTHRGDSALCLNSVTVGTAPQEVKNFECHSLNLDNLTCTWTPPPNFIKTHYSLKFFNPNVGRNAGKYKSFTCDIKLDTETGTHVSYMDLSTRTLYRRSLPMYYFTLTSSNTFGNRTQNFVFDHFAHVKPNRPTDLQVDHITQHSGQLHWSLPYPMANFPPGVRHRIMYRSDLNDTWYTLNSSGLALSSEKYSFNLTDLPYANWFYTVRVAIRSEKDVEEKYWSDYSSITFKTIGKPPQRPPTVDNGGFEVSTNLNHRNVTIYWEQLEKYEENGENFQYNVEVFTDGKQIDNLTTRGNKSYATFNSLPLKTLLFLISAANIEGESANKSRLIVPVQNGLLAEPSYLTKTALGGGRYEISWKPPMLSPPYITSCTLFWCENSQDRPFQCEGRLSWERIPLCNVTTSYFYIPDGMGYQFAISANSDSSSSGMVWSTLTMVADKPISKIKEVRIREIKPTTVEVRWNLEHFNDVGITQGYRISYCPISGLQDTTCLAPESTIMLEQNDNAGILKNLTPYTHYAMQLNIIAKHGVGPKSDPIYFRTFEAAPDPPRKITISGISSTSVVVSWEPPVNTNGVVRYYKIYLKRDESLIDSIQILAENNSAYKKELTGLLSNTKYSVYVEACTVACSELSESIEVRTSTTDDSEFSGSSLENEIQWD